MVRAMIKVLIDERKDKYVEERKQSIEELESGLEALLAKTQAEYVAAKHELEQKREVAEEIKASFEVATAAAKKIFQDA